MNTDYLFSFKTKLSSIPVPEKLNNPFISTIPPIALVAIKEFQKFLLSKSEDWNFVFQEQKGKMFGVIVVKQTDGSLVYLATNSGKLPNNIQCPQLIPSVLDDSKDDFFNRGMKELAVINRQIKQTDHNEVVDELTILRKQKSANLQKRLFENYRFSNLLGASKNVLEIFNDSIVANPPAAAGECAAPKLLQYALEHQLQPIAIAEFWWGLSTITNKKKHSQTYPACEKRCRPILEYMLNDSSLFHRANQT